MKKLLPVILILIGLGGGVTAGHFLKPAPEEEHSEDSHEAGEDAHDDEHDAKAEDAESHAEADMGDKDPLGGPTPPKDPDITYEYIKMDKQFVVPVMDNTRVASLVIISLSLEAEAGLTQEIFALEPKLRDAFLRVMFEHERAGGFAGVFTSTRLMRDLRGSLRAAAIAIVGPAVHDVLVTDILRQDL